jgi:hypothetical protein
MRKCAIWIRNMQNNDIAQVGYNQVILTLTVGGVC